MGLGMDRVGIRRSESELQQIVASADVNNSGRIDYTEFIAATLDKEVYTNSDIVWSAFNVFDLDNDGRISAAEVEHILALRGHLATHTAKHELQMVDRDGDGEIDYSEF